MMMINNMYDNKKQHDNKKLMEFQILKDI